MSDYRKQNAASSWFRASEASGDFMGIRYGRIARGSGDVEWIFVSHCECDGIGGFARLLRERGAAIPDLPRTNNPCQGIIGPLWRFFQARRGGAECANRRDWEIPAAPAADVSDPVAWHLFTENETGDILAKCRRARVTVNSLLLKHLDQAVRPDIRRSHLPIPWMIPVNLRGEISYADDTENHVSCVEPRIARDDSVEAVQGKIQRRLKRGEHRAAHLLLQLSRPMSHQAKMDYLRKDRAKAPGIIGAFSNLGVWDPEKAIATDDLWLFSPPVVKGQLLGAGCVTFHNRLGLTIQAHPELVSSEGIAEGWMQRWVDGIRT